jgi:hypothetical protein
MELQNHASENIGLPVLVKSAGNLLLQNVLMFDYLSVRDAENVHANYRFRAPGRVSAVDHELRGRQSENPPSRAATAGER